MRQPLTFSLLILNKGGVLAVGRNCKQYTEHGDRYPENYRFCSAEFFRNEGYTVHWRSGAYANEWICESADRRGTVEFRKSARNAGYEQKFTPCIAAHTRTVKKRQIMRTAALFIPIKIESGTQRTTDIAKRIAEPPSSLLKSFPLCSAVMSVRLIIKNIGSATDTKIDSAESRLKASL